MQLHNVKIVTTTQREVVDDMNTDIAGIAKVLEYLGEQGWCGNNPATLTSVPVKIEVGPFDERCETYTGDDVCLSLETNV